MKASFVSLLAAAGFAAAQDISAIPSCALQCLATAIPAAGCSGITDFACACASIDKIMTQSAECFTNACDTQELAGAQAAAKELCASIVSATGSMSIPEGTSTGTSGTASASETDTETVSMHSSWSALVPRPTPTPSTTTTVETPTSSGGSEPTGGNGEGAGSKPVIGLAAAAIAVFAAL